jgi:hypothetical protein
MEYIYIPNKIRVVESRSGASPAAGVVFCGSVMLLKRHGGCARVAPASCDARTTMTRLPHATHALHWLNSNDPDAVSCLVSFYTAHVQSVALCLTIYVFECLERGDSSHGMPVRLVG